MVTTLLRIRLVYLANFFRVTPKQFFKNLLIILVGLGVAVGLAFAPVAIMTNNPELLHDFDIIFGSMVVALICAIPFFTDKWNIQSRVLQNVASAPAKISVALLVTGVFTWPFFWVVAWQVAYMSFRPEIPLTNALTWLAFVAVLVLLLVATRLSASVNELFFDTDRKRKMRDIICGLLLFCFASVSVIMLANATDPSSAESIHELAGFLSWMPAGAPFAGMGFLSEGLAIEATVTLMFAVVAIALLYGVTISLMIRIQQTAAGPELPVEQQMKLGWFDLFIAKPASAIGARSMIYWLSDPRYRVSLIALPVIPFLVIAVLKFAGVDSLPLSFLPLPIVLTMIAWMVHNDISNDSTAFWLHVASGIKGWQDRLGRLAPVFIFGLPILLVGSAVSVMISGAWQFLPSYLSLGFVALCASAAVSSVTAVLMPYPATRPDESPFVQPHWQGAGSGASQTISFIGAFVLILPIAWLIITSLESSHLDGQMAVLGAGAIYGVVLLLIGVGLGGLIFNYRSTKILSLLQVFD